MSAIVPRTAQDFDSLAELGKMLQDSGFFKDTRSVAQAAVKVQAGRELGLGPVESMRAFHVVEGKVEMSADLLASLVKSHPKYDYRVRVMTSDGCQVEFFQGEDSLGISSFSMADAQAAGLAGRGPWKTYPRNMLFARAMSNGVAWFCPDVTMGSRVYVEGEVDAGNERPPLSVVELPPLMEPDADYRVEIAHPAGAVVVDTETGEIVGEGDEGESPAVRSGEQADPASPAQLRKLMVLAQRFQWDDDERRARAGVASFKDLTKTQASAAIEEWEALEDPAGGIRGETSVEDETPAPAASAEEGSQPEPASPEAWTRLLKHVGRNKSAVMVKARAMFGDAVSTAEALTVDQAAQLIEAALL